MNRKMITLLALGALFLAGCEEWRGATNEIPIPRPDEQQTTPQTPAAPGEETR